MFEQQDVEPARRSVPNPEYTCVIDIETFECGKADLPILLDLNPALRCGRLCT